MKQIYLFSSLLLSLFIIRETASAQVLEGRDFIPGQYLIQFDSRINVEKFQEKTAASRAGYEVEILGKESNIVTISYPTLTMDELTEYIRNLDGVVAFQKDYYLEERNKIPNDPLFTPNQWNMKIIKAPEAWDITTGGITPIGHEIVVGVLDGGFYVNHPDLIDNLFTNIAEIPGNGIDDDDNGFIDDIHGVNLDNNSGTHAEASHGTSVMGIIGAKGDNGQGVTGVNWNVKILPVSRAVANISALIRGYEYLLDFRKKFNASQGQEGAFIVATNLSAGQSHKFPIDQPIWCNMYETLGLSGIISAGATSNANEDVDEVGDLPSTCESEFLMIVTNTTSNDMLYTNSGYGFKSVDLGAPGEGCTSKILRRNERLGSR